MKAISGFLLGSTALIVGGTAASAADLLPVVAQIEGRLSRGERP